MTTKKTLTVTLSTDVTGGNDAMIEAYKAFWMTTFSQFTGFEVRVEVTTEEHEASIERMLKLVRSEFSEHDTTPPSPDLATVALDEEQSAAFRRFLGQDQG